MAKLLEAYAELGRIRELDDHRNLELRHSLATKGVHPSLEDIQRFRLFQVETRRDDLTHHGVRFTEDGYVLHVGQPQQHVLHLRRINLLAADVDQFRCATQDAQVLAVYFDGVLRIQPAVCVRSGEPASPRRIDYYSTQYSPNKIRSG